MTASRIEAASASSGSLFKNAASQAAGRLCLSLGRLGAALLIVHLLGTDRFGAYALVLNFIALFEWLVDFGQNDIAVRDICQSPAREGRILAALSWLKAIQGGVLCLALPGLLALMRYPPDIVRAGLAGGISVLCYAGVMVFRTRFKLRMCMELDVLAELGGLAVMLPLTYLACRQGASAPVLVGCYSLARLVFLLLLMLFARRIAAPVRCRARLDDLRDLAWQSAPLGFTGLMVSIYDTLATVVLSKLTDIHAVAQYAAATRFVFPVIILVQGLASAFYPPLAASWRAAPARFADLLQNALQIALLVAGGLACGVFGGAGFLMGLMGPAIAQATPVLQLMTVVVLARAVTTVMSPVLIVAGWQRMAVWQTLALVLLQTVAQLLLVPRYGIIGAVGGFLAVELLLGAVPVSLFAQAVGGFRLAWGVPLLLVGCAGGAAWLASLLPTRGGFWGGIIAGTLYLGIAIATGSFSPRALKTLLGELRSARRAAPGQRATA